MEKKLTGSQQHLKPKGTQIDYFRNKSVICNIMNISIIHKVQVTIYLMQ